MSSLRSSLLDSSDLDDAELEIVEDSAQALLNRQLEQGIKDLIQLFELDTNNATTTSITNTTTTATATAPATTTATTNATATTTATRERGKKRGRSNSQAAVAGQEKALGKAPKVWPVTERILRGRK